MIKFFRHIRKSLIEQNKMGKYFKYAIGEIILVVIGILIALQINTWNEDRKNRVKEKVYITNIQRDLKAQLVILDRASNGELSSFTSLSNAQKSYHQHNKFIVNTKSLAEISAINDRFTFNIIDTALEEIKSSGNLDIIQNRTVKDSLLKYYDEIGLYGQIISSNNLGNDLTAMDKSMALTSVMGDDSKAWLDFNAGIADTFKKMPDNILELVSKSINIPENALVLYNLINYKKSVSFFHFTVYKEVKKKIHDLNNLLLENYSFLEK
ncbi:DUF6090 family protein [Ichthyenterobacterium sp. W332]|uniref:DUF6090 family protein n=1 Tax=Microcosmobacter mediterraneus TaxID=3075607 RepID=A0ABU2YJI8_9FLAO|nr:DUF6090 family protein [Ichthyenterobacterium sp. W332]MDT0558335.1 DUF6090 family protein [Ichthyenterobacterium sp. W332]